MTSDQVAAEMVKIQLQADTTARQWLEASLRSDELALQLTSTQRDLDATSREMAQIDLQLDQIAIGRFVGQSRPFFAPLIDDPMRQVAVDQYQGVALGIGQVHFDDADALRSDLEAQRLVLTDLQTENDGVQQMLTSTQNQIEQQLAQLAALFEQLKDDEARQAYRAEVARQRALLDAQQPQPSEAIPGATPSLPDQGSPDQGSPVATLPSPSPVPLPPGPAVTSPNPVVVPPTNNPAVPAPSTTKPPVPIPSVTKPPTPAPPPSVVKPPAPAPPPSVVKPPAPVPTTQPPVATNPPPTPVIQGGFICPVAGPNAFVDTWGAARSGGRRHEGVDMMSPKGTPLVAVVSGLAKMKTNTLGGNTVWLVGNDGNSYYYAHLSAWAGPTRQVSAGEVVGFVGATGNTTANHLHFGIYPGGGSAINPYPTVRRAC